MTPLPDGSGLTSIFTSWNRPIFQTRLRSSLRTAWFKGSPLRCRMTAITLSPLRLWALP